MPNLPSNLKFKLLQIALRPLVRFALGNSVKLQELLPLLKAEYVSEATQQLKKKGLECSASRIAVMTGVHRRDVSLLEKTPQIEPDDSVISKIIGHWQVDRRFSEKGRPKSLEVTGKQSEFADLVRSAHSELNPYTILFELERMGIIRKQGDKISLIKQEFVPKKNAVDTFSLYSRDGSDLLQAVQQNALGINEIPNLHLTTEFDNIPTASLPEIRQWFLTEGEKLHHKARRFLSRYDKDLHPRLKEFPGEHRVSIGTFSLSAPIHENNETELEP